MTTDFERALAKLLGIEGGYANDPNDRGGETRFGITKKKALEHGYEGAMSQMPLSIAHKIYKLDYWDFQALDQVSAWDPRIAYEIFECGVNQGTGTAAVYFQRILNVIDRNSMKPIRVDGRIGSGTIAYMQKFSDATTKNTILTALNCLQGEHYVAIMERDPTQEGYARNWLSRARVEG